MRHRLRTLLVLSGLAALLVATLPPARAATTLGPWKPLFKGIDHATGTNAAPGADFTNEQVIQAIRIDLTDPDVRLLASPRIDNYVANFRETGGYTVSDFLLRNRLQLAINVNTFDPNQYYLPAGTPMDVGGLLVSGGEVVSPQDSAAHASVIRFTADKQAEIIHTNWPAASNDGVHTAAAGEYPVVVHGENIGTRYLNDRDVIHRTHPRTAFGLSKDRKTLFLLTIDGRQRGFSEGALDWETAGWMLKLGAWDAVNMDGGGSTTLVMESATGKALRLNRPSPVADSGRERTIGAHFGVFALPVSGFVRNIQVTPEDTSAIVRWSTPEPATSQIAWGPTGDLESLTPELPSLVTNHLVVLSDLTPSTSYYYEIRSRMGETLETSQVRTFTTTNYATTRLAFEVTQPWKYSTANLENTPWTRVDYDDSAWSGPGSGLWWIDVRPAGPNPKVQPRNEPLPPNPLNSGYPYVTYYFRTHFTAASAAPGSTLRFSSWIDDGAVLYLNGQEIHRLNMPEAPTPIGNQTLATGFSLSGDATASVDFEISGEGASRLVPGDNVLAVEVHNYNALSPDATFGLALTLTEPRITRPKLSLLVQGPTRLLNWNEPGFLLQQSAQLEGPWSDVPGPVMNGPYLVRPAPGHRFFRLRK